MPFFSKPPPLTRRSYLPVAHTGEMYTDEKTAAYAFADGLKQRLAPDMQTDFWNYVTKFNNDATNDKDESSRAALMSQFQMMEKASRNAGRRHREAADDMHGLINAIERSVKDVYARGTRDHTRGKILEYELRDGLDPTNRIFLFWILPCCQGDEDDTSLLKQYHEFDDPWYEIIKWLMMAILILLYALSLVWLTDAQLTLYACQQGSPSLAQMGIIITDALTHHPLSCPELLKQCHIPFGNVLLADYYSMRIVSYVVGALPIVFLMSSTWVISARLLAPFGDGKLHTPSEDGATHKGKTHMRYPDFSDGRIKRTWALFSKDQFEVSTFYSSTAWLLVLTHWLGGGIALALDISTASYFGGLPSACGDLHLPGVASNATGVNAYAPTSPLDPDCACAILFLPSGDTRGLTRVSDVEIMNPRGIAIALAIFNVMYILWGIWFVIQVWRLKLSAHAPTHLHRSNDHSTHDDLMGQERHHLKHKADAHDQVASRHSPLDTSIHEINMDGTMHEAHDTVHATHDPTYPSPIPVKLQHSQHSHLKGSA